MSKRTEIIQRAKVLHSTCQHDAVVSKEYPDVCILAGSLLDEVNAREMLTKALQLTATRMHILTGRMRGCHEETGKHELLDEADMFCAEALIALDTFGAKPCT